MLELVPAVVGGLCGAVLGFGWKAPYREAKGGYTAAELSFANPVLRAGVGAVCGAAVALVVAPIVAVDSVFGVVAALGFLVAAYIGLTDDDVAGES